MASDLFDTLGADPEASQVLDGASLRETLDGDPELFHDLVGIFLEDLPEQLAAVHAAAGGRDVEALGSAAHALKGAVAMFAARGARQAALELEQHCRQGDLEPALALVGRLEEELSRLMPVLRRYGEAG